MLMIVLDDLVKELVELVVRALRSSIDTDSRVKVLAAREDASLETDSFII